MTALLFYLEPDRVCIAMDTRTLDIDDATGDRTIGAFCSKMLVLPHLRGVICCTGIRSLAFQWHAFVQQSTASRDMPGLDHIAAAILPQLARDCGVTAKLTATVYHFGHCSETREFVGRAFRSTDGFKPEPLDNPSFAIKPPDGLDFDQAWRTCREKGLPEGFVEVMKAQKAIDDARPSNQRLGIGGEVQFLLMMSELYSLSTCHRFADYEADLTTLLSRGR